MPPRTRNNIGSTSDDLVEQLIACTTPNCPVHTKVLVPANFDCSQPFTCGFCCASNQLKHSKSYSEAVTNSLKNEQQTRATLFAEIQQEQSRKDAKRLFIRKRDSHLRIVLATILLKNLQIKLMYLSCHLMFNVNGLENRSVIQEISYCFSSLKK